LGQAGESSGGVIDTGETALVGVLVVVGVVGVILPVLPGLLLIWGAGLWWAIGDGGGAGHWLVFAVMSVLLVAGMSAKYVLPAKATSDRGAPFSTLAIGVVGAVAGFFLIPVLGVLVGFVLGVYLAEFVRLRDGSGAWRSTRTALIAIGIGLLVEFAAGLAMAFTWLAGLLVT
jgi:uncharacterized protein YqgC (DUF456 family)